MDKLNEIINNLEEELKKYDTATYCAVIKTNEDFELWNVLVMHFASCLWIKVKIINHFEYDDDVVEMQISKKL